MRKKKVLIATKSASFSSIERKLGESSIIIQTSKILDITVNPILVTKGNKKQLPLYDIVKQGLKCVMCDNAF